MCTYVLLSLQGPNCTIANHPGIVELKDRRIRFYFLSTILSEQCLGSKIYTVRTYLVIDDATSDDAGNYTFNITFGSASPIILEETIDVVVGM